MFKFTLAISFFVHCETQHETDDYWEVRLDGGAGGGVTGETKAHDHAIALGARQSEPFAASVL